jgi:hypothetical protein
VKFRSGADPRRRISRKVLFQDSFFSLGLYFVTDEQVNVVGWAVIQPPPNRTRSPALSFAFLPDWSVPRNFRSQQNASIGPLRHEFTMISNDAFASCKERSSAKSQASIVSGARTRSSFPRICTHQVLCSAIVFINHVRQLIWNTNVLKTEIVSGI